jgi:O-antigen ligase
VQRYDISFISTDGGAGRLDIWKSILSNYNSSTELKKFFGWGAGTIPYFTYNGEVGHDIWIESLVEIGIIGVMILFIFYYIYFRKACRIREYVVAASFIGYMIMTLSLSLYSYKPIWNIILLIILLKNRKQFEQKQQLNCPVINNSVGYERDKVYTLTY